MVVTIIVFASIQFIVGLLFFVTNIVGWHQSRQGFSNKNNSEETIENCRKWMRAESKRTKIAGTAMILSPLAIFSIPALILFGLFKLMQKIIVPVITYQEA